MTIKRRLHTTRKPKSKRSDVLKRFSHNLKLHFKFFILRTFRHRKRGPQVSILKMPSLFLQLPLSIVNDITPFLSPVIRSISQECNTPLISSYLMTKIYCPLCLQDSSYEWEIERHPEYNSSWIILKDHYCIA